jgi:hypothetical protein
MATINVKDLLSKPADSFERPPVFPAGHYLGTIVKHEFDKSRAKKTPLIRFYLNPTAPSDDVDPEDVANIDLKKVLWRYEFYLTPTAMYRLADFLDAVLGESTESLDERIPSTSGTEVLIGIRQRTNDEGEVTGNEVTKVTAAE